MLSLSIFISPMIFFIINHLNIESLSSNLIKNLRLSKSFSGNLIKNKFKQSPINKTIIKKPLKTHQISSKITP